MQEIQELAQTNEYLEKNAYPIIKHMVNDLLLNMPEKPVEFMIGWLREKGNENYNSEDESSQSQSDGELQITNINREHRKSVSAEVYGQLNPQPKYQPEVYPKSEEMKKEIRELIKDIFMFSYLGPKELEIIVDAFQIENFNDKDFIIKQGDQGDKLYMVYQGQLRCFKTQENIEIFLTEYSKGGIFGELALLYNTPRAASIVSIGNSILFSMSRQTFNGIVKERAIQQRQKYDRFLSTVNLFENLNDYERQKISDCLRAEYFQPNQTVIKEGDIGDRFYLVIQGQLKAMKINKKGIPEEVMCYQDGSYFGELALLNDQTRKATILTVTECELASIDRKSFKNLVGSFESILRRKQESYVSFNQQINKDQFIYYQIAKYIEIQTLVILNKIFTFSDFPIPLSILLYLISLY